MVIEQVIEQRDRSSVMGLFDRLGRVIRANVNHFVNQAEDPERVLELTVQEMQADLIELRQAVAQAIATQKRTERQAAQAQTTAEEWYRRAQLAAQKGDDMLAREALTRRQSYQNSATALNSQVNQQRDVVTQLKRNMVTLEAKLAEARTKKDMYIARARSARASEKLNQMLSKVGNDTATAAFERMEERILQMEARSEAIAELNTASDAIENRFKALEGNDIETELANIKTQFSGQSIPGQSTSLSSYRTGSIEEGYDAEVERLRSKLEGH